MQTLQLFIGVEEDKKNRVINNGLLPKGYMSQRSVHTAWEYVGEEYSLRYSGLLFMNDDSYVDPINLNEMNLSYSYYEGNAPVQKGDDWVCWDWRYGDKKAFRYNVKEINASPELKSVWRVEMGRDAAREVRFLLHHTRPVGVVP